MLLVRVAGVNASFVICCCSTVIGIPLLLIRVAGVNASFVICCCSTVDSQ
ncbi:MAG TPA: hypothetical protein VEW92_09435 [Nitrososphaeraceae archaeon]|nr:hypothetical protein [Nitrososphaeraceae archaeon]